MKPLHRKLVRSIAALAVLAGVATWLITDHYPLSALGPEQRSLESADEHGAAVSTPSAPLGSAERSAALVGSTAGEKTSTGASSSAEIVVRVIDEATLEPLAGATVALGEAWPTRFGMQVMVEFFASDPERRALEQGVVRTTNSVGEVRLVSTPQMRFVCARFGRSYRNTAISTNDKSPLVLALRPHHDLTIAVADESGIPQAGMAIAVSESPRDFAHPLGLSRADGLLIVPNFETRLEWLGLYGDGEIALFCDSATGRDRAVWLDPAQITADPMRLVVVPGGGLRIRLVDDFGAVLPLSGRIALSTMLTMSTPTRSVMPKTEDVWLRLEHGTAFAQGVPLGSTWELHVNVGAGGFTHGPVKGPRAAGEIVDVAVPGTSQGRRLSLRAVDEQGSPLSGCRVSCVVVLIGPPLFVSSNLLEQTSTENDGTFDLCVPRFAPTSDSSTLWLELAGPGAGLAAQVSIAQVLVAGSTEPARVTFLAKVPLVHGVVRDALGHPMTASVSLYSQALKPVRLSGLQGGLSRADGSYRLFGPCLPGLLRVGVDDGKLGGQDGASGVIDDCSARVDLMVQRGGVIEGSMLGRVGVPSSIELCLVKDGEAVERRPVRLDNEDSPFSFHGLDAGTYRLEARRVAVAPALLVVDGILVSLTEVIRDPRLQGLRFDEQLDNNLLCSIVDEAEKRVERGAAWFVLGTSETAVRWSSGTLPVPRGSEGTCFVHAEGFRAGSFDLANAPRSLRLAKPLSVRIQVSGADPSLVAGRRWWVQVKSLATPVAAHLIDPSIVLDEHGTVSLDWPLAARFFITLSLTRPELAGEEFSVVLDEVPLASPYEIEIKDQDAEQVVEIQVDGDELRRLLEAEPR